MAITVDGLPVAVLEPLKRRTRWMAREAFVNEILAHRADATLAAELKALAPHS